MSAYGEAIAKLDAHGVDQLCDDIIDGKSYADIGRSLQISKSAIHRWIEADPERSARVRAALKESAQSCDDEALDVLRDKTIDPARAREIASHLRWRAKVRDQSKYGEKLQVDNTHAVLNLSREEIAKRRAAIQEQLAQVRGELPPPADVGIPISQTQAPEGSTP